MRSKRCSSDCFADTDDAIVKAVRLLKQLPQQVVRGGLQDTARGVAGCGWVVQFRGMAMLDCDTAWQVNGLTDVGVCGVLVGLHCSSSKAAAAAAGADAMCCLLNMEHLVGPDVMGKLSEQCQGVEWLAATNGDGKAAAACCVVSSEATQNVLVIAPALDLVDLPQVEGSLVDWLPAEVSRPHTPIPSCCSCRTLSQMTPGMCW